MHEASRPRKRYCVVYSGATDRWIPCFLEGGELFAGPPCITKQEAIQLAEAQGATPTVAQRWVMENNLDLEAV